MNQLGVACLMMIFINVQARPGAEKNSDQNGQGTAEKRFIQHSGNYGATTGFKIPVADQDSARLEPTFKDYRGYDVLQNVLIKTFNPTPIVDNIQEHEKYGNDGSQHQLIGTALVRGSEKIANLLNAAIDAPKIAIKTVASSATAALNQLGAKLIGL